MSQKKRALLTGLQAFRQCSDKLGGTIQNPITLSDANDWQYIYPALVDAGASLADYTIEESTTNNTDSLVRYQVGTEGPNSWTHFGYIGQDNTLKTTSFTVTKNWQNNGELIIPSSVSVRLQQSIDSGKNYTDVEMQNNVTLSDQNQWTQTWNNLPAYTAGNELILYRAVEEDVADYTASYGTVSGTSTDGYKETITNTSNYTTLHVEKKWIHGQQSQEDWPNAVSISLLANGEEVYTGILRTENNWAGTFYDMPIYDDEGKAIVYTVDELTVDGYTKSIGQITGNAIGGYQVVITNTHIDPTPTPSNPPEPNDPNIPNTGDATNATVWAVVLFGSLAAIITLLIFKKKKS